MKCMCIIAIKESHFWIVPSALEMSPISLDAGVFFRGAIEGKTDKIAVFPWFVKTEHSGGRFYLVQQRATPRWCPWSQYEIHASLSHKKKHFESSYQRFKQSQFIWMLACSFVLSMSFYLNPIFSGWNWDHNKPDRYNLDERTWTKLFF